LPEAEWHLTVLEKETAVRDVEERIAAGYDLFFNLCDGAADQEDTPGIEVVEALERAGVPFTGATSEFYEPSREAMKAACRRASIDTPAYVCADNEADAERGAKELRFPLIVKHPSSYASVALSRASRVVSVAGLRRQVKKMLRRFGGVLIEEFVDGTECTVLVAESPADPSKPTTFTPMQYRFPAGESFKHENLKWVDFDGMTCTPVADPVLDARLRDVSARFFVELRGASYGRCDLRVDRRGRPFMLEINANCGLYYPPSAPGSADLCLAHDPAGHAGFTRQIVEAALGRHARRRQSSVA
jgi:D-alanine-D-alanine ligase